MSGAKHNTIRRVMRSKIDAWLETITDAELKKAIQEDVMVCGGALASMLVGEKINDFDIYFRTKETTERVARYYAADFIARNPNLEIKPEVRTYKATNIKGIEEERVGVWVQSAGITGEMVAENQAAYQYFEGADNAHGDRADEYVQDQIRAMKEDIEGSSRDPYRPVFMSQNAITLSTGIQIVIRFFGEPSDIYNNYDFAHVQQSYLYRENKLDLNMESMSSLLSRTLIYRGSLYPLCSIFRVKKFIERGWRISAGQMLKIAYQVSELDLDDIDTMKDQLTGVDAFYMRQVIALLEKDRLRRQEAALLEGHEGVVRDIDATYLMKIIDEIFDAFD